MTAKLESQWSAGDRSRCQKSVNAIFMLKARREEAWLDERYAGYAGYRASTRRRFLPWVI